jgi:hypothetical protein
MARGPLVDPEVRQKVARWVAVGERSPAAIARAVQRELDEAYKGKVGALRPGLPTERTIARLVKELTARAAADDSTPWSLASATPDEAAVVMPVLGALLAESAALLRRFPDDPRVAAMARSRRLTAGLAKWLVKVAAAAPTLPSYEQFLVAREHRAAELSAAGKLARPWGSPSRRRWTPSSPAAPGSQRKPPRATSFSWSRASSNRRCCRPPART